jgi:hypothetical protein
VSSDLGQRLRGVAQHMPAIMVVAALAVALALLFAPGAAAA